MREEGLIFPLRTAKFLRAGWMVFASLFRKEKNQLNVFLQTLTLLVAKQRYGDQNGFLFNLPARTTKI